MLEEKRPGLTITEKPGGLLHKQLVDYDGSVLLDETVFPHDDLIRFMHRPLKEYNQRLTNLEQHPLFEESLDIYIPDFEDFIEQCFAVVDSLQSEYPEAYFLIRIALEDLLIVEDDGSAGILLQTGAQMLHAVQSLHLARVQMRNIMEVCFGTTDGMTQHERWTRIATIYPPVYYHPFAVRWKADESNWVREYEMRSLTELYLFEVCAALRSDKRIARCQHCWRYFVPKTKKKTDYCDRVWKDGSTCKQRGPNLKRKDGPSEDKYLLAFKKLRARFYERDYRYYADQPGLSIPFGSYSDWIEVASSARIEYLDGTISGEEFLRQINPAGENLELDSPAQPSAEKILSSSWERLVHRDMSFDPKRHFVDMLKLDLGEENPQWKLITAEEQIKAAKHGNISLREKYKKK